MAITEEERELFKRAIEEGLARRDPEVAERLKNIKWPPKEKDENET